MRIIFMGTPDFALLPLKAIWGSRHEIVAVVTQPDRPGNRNKLVAPSVKTLAIELGIPVYQYEKISREGVSDMQSLNADIMVTCAFGQILSQQMLDICKYGVINIHASLLPKYRGSCPIHWAIINGDKEAGVTIMQTAKAVDSGDIILSQSLPILPTDTSCELFDNLSELGANLIVSALDNIENNTALRVPQDHTKATFCPMLTRSDGLMDYDKTTEQLDCFVRGMTPWPSAFTVISGENVKVFKVSKIDTIHALASDTALKIGTILTASHEQGLIIACRDGAVSIDELQFAGGKRMSAKDYFLGHHIDLGGN